MRRWLRTSTLAVALFACESPARSVPDAPTVPVTIETSGGPVTFEAEIADTPEERARGLMFRTELGERDAMLFVFPAEEPLSFWMKNTLVPLDMVFIRADHSILGVVHRAEPRTLTPRRVEGASQYVLEIRGGLAEHLDVRPGQRARFMAPAAER